MQHSDLGNFLARHGGLLAKGPVAVVMAEDSVEIDSTLRHHLKMGFFPVILLTAVEMPLAADLSERVHRIRYDAHAENALMTAVNLMIEAAPGTWFHYGYNAEYLFFPFCETRSIREMLTFQTEERRDAVLSYVIDLYAPDLDRHPDAVCLEGALLDRSGYYALGRRDPANHNHPRERQLDFFGGLRWRFEEHIPPARRKIDRIALFRAKPGLRLRPDFTFTDEEYNTYACPWHHNITTAIASFRTAKALKRNPGSTFDIHTFRWHNSTEFEWHSQQLMDLGLMEPGQWF
ncbi:hypothetical protein [Szabonella alba]|uniref:Glycosyl transferase family 2 n=1 Tax=Szabonella alba TaxID=2804194 RepID=A0A8K0VC52_9RHOB|nr:hypothetical protein [Szabonella alba]MBL4918291.1 hypothetical protein [Szabonella alba]